MQCQARRLSPYYLPLERVRATSGLELAAVWDAHTARPGPEHCVCATASLTHWCRVDNARRNSVPLLNAEELFLEERGHVKSCRLVCFVWRIREVTVNVNVNVPVQQKYLSGLALCCHSC